MAAQLGHLLTAGALPQVSLDIVPMATAGREQWPRETFHVYDGHLISVELVPARVAGLRAAAQHGCAWRRRSR
ncbi:hypothetical protein ACIF83_40340 [Streptomyces sp. NPDC085866]|uniref:hypothetical protein n=1 Tax=Streptomyces sp. NPDC085866 TaxID=3365736 RepID=UPI0037D05352